MSASGAFKRHIVVWKKEITAGMLKESELWANMESYQLMSLLLFLKWHSLHFVKLFFCCIVRWFVNMNMWCGIFTFPQVNLINEIISMILHHNFTTRSRKINVNFYFYKIYKNGTFQQGKNTLIKIKLN